MYGALYGVVAVNFFAQTLADCTGTLEIFGSLKASSLVSSMVVAEGVINSILSPFFGGFADVTPHRKIAFGVTFFVLMLGQVLQGVAFLPGERTRQDPNDAKLLLPEPLLREDSVLIVAALVYIASAVAFELNALLLAAYAPELTKDEEKQHGFIADAYGFGNVTQLTYTIVMTAFAFALNLGPFTSAVVSAVLSIVWSVGCFVYAYPRLGERTTVDPELDTRCLGAAHIISEICSGMCKYPDLFIFLFSWAPIAASSSNAISLATSYLQFHLNFSSLEIQGLLALSLVMTVPGAILARVLMQSVKVPPKKVYMAVALVQGTSFILAPLVLTSDPVFAKGNGTLSVFGRCDDPIENTVIAVKAGPGVLYITAGFVLLWGLLSGMIYPVNVALFSLLIPGGKETTYFGIKVTFSKILNWLPALLFTIINEAGSLQYSIAPLGAMSLTALIIASFIDVERGSTAIEDTLKYRRGVGAPETSKDEQVVV